MDDNFKIDSVRPHITNKFNSIQMEIKFIQSRIEDNEKCIERNDKKIKQTQKQINESKERIKRIDKAIEQYMFIFKIWAVIFPVILIAIMCGYIWWIK